jgi:hypothetical protein
MITEISRPRLRVSLQLAKVLRVHWSNYSGHVMIGEILSILLAKLLYTLANWRHSMECVGESTVDFCHWRVSCWRKSYWRSSGNPIFQGENSEFLGFGIPESTKPIPRIQRILGVRADPGSTKRIR